jgi:hypothetical protein
VLGVSISARRYKIRGKYEGVKVLSLPLLHFIHYICEINIQYKISVCVCVCVCVCVRRQAKMVVRTYTKSVVEDQPPRL